MIIEYIFRPKNKTFSIEKVFNSIIHHLNTQTNLMIEKSEVKTFKFWPLTLLFNILRYSFKSYKNKNKIYHITGDVQYVGILMNSKNTILTIHDILLLINYYRALYCRLAPQGL